MKNKKNNILKLVFLVLYFIILTVERTMSVVTMIKGNFSSYNILDYYMLILTIFSIIGTYIFICLKCGNNIKCIDDKTFDNLSIAAGILLLGGMVHTEGTILPIQFISYGMLLISMGIHTIQSMKNKGNKIEKLISFLYIVAFSMSIPVVYHANIKYEELFYVVEVIVSFTLVIFFTIMLREHYLNNGDCKFSLYYFLFAVIGDILVIILRLEETINYFVLIFIVITIMFWIIGKCIKKEKNNNF